MPDLASTHSFCVGSFSRLANLEPRDWIALAAAVIALATLSKAVVEYRRQISLKRFEAFQSMLARFNEHDRFEELANLCAVNDPALAQYDVHAKTDYAGFFEELALMVNSKLLREGVASQMFGSYLRDCASASHFWTAPAFDRTHYYWSMFDEFAARMERFERSQGTRRTLLRPRFRF